MPSLIKYADLLQATTTRAIFCATNCILMPVKHSIIKISLLFAFIFFTAGNLIAQLPKVACGTIKRLENFPSKFVDARNVDIWLPEGYSAKK